MAMFDFFKKKKGVAKAPWRAKEKARKDETSKQTKSEEKPDIKPIVLKESENAWQVLRQPHVTEKSTNLTALNQYVFKIFVSATKPEVKKAIEEVYNVHVERVRKITVPRKKRRRRGRYLGWKSGYTKAIVTLKRGDKIEILPH